MGKQIKVIGSILMLIILFSCQQADFVLEKDYLGLNKNLQEAILETSNAIQKEGFLYKDIILVDCQNDYKIIHHSFINKNWIAYIELCNVTTGKRVLCFKRATATPIFMEKDSLIYVCNNNLNYYAFPLESTEWDIYKIKCTKHKNQ